MAWKDEKNRDGTIRETTAHFGRMRLTVHHHRDYPLARWLFTCHDLNLVAVLLVQTELERAKAEAVAHVVAHLREALTEAKAIPLTRSSVLRKAVSKARGVRPKVTMQASDDPLVAKLLRRPGAP